MRQGKKWPFTEKKYMVIGKINSDQKRVPNSCPRIKSKCQWLK